MSDFEAESEMNRRSRLHQPTHHGDPKADSLVQLSKIGVHMITVRLDDGSLLRFDGTVVEHFYGAKSRRAHVGTISGIKFETDRNGMPYQLQIQGIAIGGYQRDVFQLYLWNHNNTSAPFSESVYAKLNEMVAEIEEAMSAFHADNE